MITYNQLNSTEQNKIREKALKFYSEHKNRIYQGIKQYPNQPCPKISPSGSDLYHPELWKEIHWAWFLDNSFLL